MRVSELVIVPSRPVDDSPYRHRLFLIAAAVLFSTGGAAIKATSLTEWQVAGFRSAVAAAVLFTVLPDARRGWSWRLTPVASAYAATLVLFVVATKLTTSAHAIFLQSTAPLYILLLGPYVLAERVRRSDMAYVAALGVGMVCLFLDAQPALATAPDPPRGNAIAATAGLTWALTIMGLRWIGRESGEGPSTTATVVAGNVIAFLAALPAALPVARFTKLDLVVILYLGSVQIGLAYVFLSRAIRYLPAFEATTLLLLEPVMNPIWAWIVEGEKPGPPTLAGGFIIVSATLVNAWRNARRSTRQAGLAV